MIEWAFPGVLLAAPLVVWAVVFAWRRRPRLTFSSNDLLRPGRSLGRSVAFLPELLLVAGLLCVLVALARPQWTQRETVVRSEGIDILLVVDTSGSMDSPDYTVGGRPASRLDVAKAVVGRFVEGRPHDRIGLVVFGEEAFTQVPLTLDHVGLASFLGQVQIGMAGSRSTAVGEALAVATRRLARLEAPSRVVILLTDGRNNAGTLDPETAAQAAAALGIKVYTIGVGASGEIRGPLGLLSRPRGGDLDEPTLRAIANATGGQYWRAGDTETLRRVYEIIDALETSTAEVKEVVHAEERYHAWLFAGMILLALQAVLSTTILRRLP
ncbi:MAG: VWA domain-containing protein [Deltaproteobacteria bacterium]|nr:VWA domain-containing protein [Deltaproteobacteria bacterium]